jgi:hypothetical protein
MPALAGSAWVLVCAVGSRKALVSRYSGIMKAHHWAAVALAMMGLLPVVWLGTRPINYGQGFTNDGIVWVDCGTAFSPARSPADALDSCPGLHDGRRIWMAIAAGLTAIVEALVAVLGRSTRQRTKPTALSRPPLPPASDK